MRPLIVIRRTPKIDFMAWHKMGFAFSAFLTVSSIVLFLTMGLNYGIDFVGGTLIEVRSTSGPANLAEMRRELDSLHIGEASLQGFGAASDVLIWLPHQPGGDAAQEQAVAMARKALGAGIDYRRVEVVGPSVGSELIRAGIIATVLALLAIAGYIWFRFEWQFGVGGMISTLHDVITTIGLFALLRLEFDLTTLAAILTVAGYSVNDTVVIYDRVREALRKYRSMPFRRFDQPRPQRNPVADGPDCQHGRAGGAVPAVPGRPGAARVQHRDALGGGDRHLFLALHRRAGALLRAAEPRRDRPIGRGRARRSTPDAIGAAIGNSSGDRTDPARPGRPPGNRALWAERVPRQRRDPPRAATACSPTGPCPGLRQPRWRSPGRASFRSSSTAGGGSAIRARSANWHRSSIVARRAASGRDRD